MGGELTNDELTYIETLVQSDLQIMRYALHKGTEGFRKPIKMAEELLEKVRKM